MITELSSITPEYLKHRLEEQKEYYEQEIERLNNIIKYLEQYFSKREYYEFAQLVRETKEANIEWLENAVKEEKK